MSTTKTTNFFAGINMLEGIVGIGILTLPYLFSQTGWIAGLILMLIIGYLAWYCAHILMVVADDVDQKNKVKNYPDFINTLSENKYSWLMNFILFVGQITTCVVYSIFFTQYLQESFCFLQFDNLCTSRVPNLILPLLVLIPLSLIQNLKQFQKWSLFGQSFAFLTCLVLLFNFSQMMLEQKDQKDFFENYNVGILINLPTGISVASGAFGCTGLYFDIRYSMQKGQCFSSVFLKVTHFVVLIYSAVGCFGYFAYSDQVKEIILLNLPRSNYIYACIQIIYCIVLLICYPFQLFPVKKITEDSCAKKQDNQQNEYQSIQQNEQIQIAERGVGEELCQEFKDEGLTIYKIIVSILLTMIIFFFNIMIPQIYILFSFVNSFTQIPLSFLIPIIVYQKCAKNIKWYVTLFNFFIFLFGVFIMILGIYYSGLAIYTYYVPQTNKKQ